MCYYSILVFYNIWQIEKNKRLDTAKVKLIINYK